MSDYEKAKRARNHLWATFFLMGVLALAWVPRIPEIKDQLGLSDGVFGFVLLGGTLGAVPGAQLSGRAVHRFASRPFAQLCGIVMPLGLFIMAHANHVYELLLGMALMGFAFASLDVAANVQGVAIEKHMKARYMSTFHGAWSVGAFTSTLFGGAIARHVSPRDNLQYLALISFFALLYATYGLLDSKLDGYQGEEDEKTEAKVPLFSKSVIPLWGLGFGLMASLIPEGGAYDWSGILLKDHMGIGKGVTAAAATTFSLGMIISRLLGDKAFDRWGHRNTVKYGGYIGGSCWGGSILIAIPLSASHQLLALIIICTGFAIAGLCIGPFYPAFNLAASSIPGIAPSVGLARIAVISIAAYFAGPTVIGLISQATSLPIAFIFPVGFLFLAGYQSRFIVVKEIK